MSYYKNHEGYSDYTAGAALSKIEREERIKLIEDVKKLIESHGYTLVSRLVLRDNDTGRIYK